MKNKKLSVIVPIYNGEKFIRKNLNTLKESLSRTIPNYEIIVVIDGLVDKSLNEAKKVSGIHIHGYNKNRGKGFALRYGFSKSTGDIITFIDGDLDLHPDQLANFFPYLATADLIIGSKRHPFSRLRYPWSRKFLSKGYQWFCWLVLGVNLRDTQSGLKIIKRDVLDVIMPLLVIKRHAFDLELCFLAQKHGFRMVEAPISINYQFSGTSINTRTIYGMFMDTLAIRYRYSIKKYYQKKFHSMRFKT